ncbi:MAG: DUF167 domain-containing protein [Candidatus Saganbacteria bacterium]|nr:DUF167 domain-containing protein [Candidatus Saganbacteria bacterium]
MKRINVKVIPNAKKQRIIEEEKQLKIYVNAPALEGKANEAVIEALMEHFKIKKKQIKILSGEKNRKKIIGIDL